MKNHMLHHYIKKEMTICNKILEAQELVDASNMGNKEIVHESADLLFHVLVLLVQRTSNMLGY